MIDYEDIRQAIYEYADTKFSEEEKLKFQEYVDEFPENDWDLPEETWANNFFSWLFLEKVFPESGRTVAEEYAENTPDLDPGIKERIHQIRNMIRSEFIVLSRTGSMMKVKDRNSEICYTVRIFSDSLTIPPNTLLTGRIHPFGDHYHFAGVFLMSTPSFILDPQIFIGAWESRELDRFESIQLRRNSTLRSILNKYPSHWIDWMGKQYGIKERLKKDRVRRVETTIIEDLPRIFSSLPEPSREVLALCMKEGGVVKYGRLKNYDDDMGLFWEEEHPGSTIGILRQKGFLVVGKMRMGERNYKVAFIPVEIRDGVQDLLESDASLG